VSAEGGVDVVGPASNTLPPILCATAELDRASRLSYRGKLEDVKEGFLVSRRVALLAG
jgi:hypothetical protein